LSRALHRERCGIDLHLGNIRGERRLLLDQHSHLMPLPIERVMA
jgi:hypothetical protein